MLNGKENETLYKREQRDFIKFCLINIETKNGGVFFVI